MFFTKHSTVFPTSIIPFSFQTLKKKEGRMQLHIPLNCSPYHRPIYQSSYPPLSDCHAEKRSYPYFRVPPDETRMKYPLFTGPRTEFTNVGLRRVYPFRATPPSPPSPSSVMNFPPPTPSRRPYERNYTNRMGG